ncbi:hypothetical protein NXY42_21165 [Bacteroides fragilis]|nr:hypothetical protein [Bacteroides fragilis]
MIFEVVNASNDDWTDRNGIAYLLNENGYADAIVTKSFMNMLSQVDPKRCSYRYGTACSI